MPNGGIDRRAQIDTETVKALPPAVAHTWKIREAVKL